MHESRQEAPNPRVKVAKNRPSHAPNCPEAPPKAPKRSEAPKEPKIVWKDLKRLGIMRSGYLKTI